MASRTSSAPLGDAIALTPAQRRTAMHRFFLRHPGTARGPLGCGRALVEFQEWQVASGRIGGGAGSPWWSAVNGRLVLDLRAAAAVLAAGTTPAPEPAVAAWIAYAHAGRSAAQGALWAAHQASLAGAVDAASALLVAEPRHEQAFAMVVLEVVEAAARDRLPTDDGTLGALARRSYPAAYPVSAHQLARLTAELAAAPRRQSGSR